MSCPIHIQCRYNTIWHHIWKIHATQVIILLWHFFFPFMLQSTGLWLGYSPFLYTDLDQMENIQVGAVLDTVKWDDKGLAVAIAQNIDTGAILMQGFANREALATTISSRKATFYSRSRSSLWTKGETSTNFINIHDIFLDCDRDSVSITYNNVQRVLTRRAIWLMSAWLSLIQIIYLGKPDGPTCHTGAETCYYSSVFGLLEEPQVLNV